MAKSEPTIEISAELLQRLHRIHRQIADLRGQIERAPRRIAVGESIVQKARQAVTDAADAIKKTKLLADQKQLQLREREQRIFNLKGKQNEASGNREYDLLKEQIAADLQANSVLSDEILELLERLDQLEIDRKARQVELDERQIDHQKLVGVVQEELVAARDALAGVEAERLQAEGLLPEASRSEYQRLIAHRGEDAFAAIDGENCGGCNQLLTMQLVSRLKMSHLVRCPSCNAFLYNRPR